MAEDNASNLQTIATKLKVTTKTPEKSSEAALSDLTLDGITITGFDSEKIAYTIELAAKTTEIPTVVAIATDSKATVNITQATELPGVTTVVVTAEDGTTKIYTINFTLAPQEEPTIVKINDLTALVKVGEAYTLPKTVIALMSDDTTRELPVTWKPSTADTDEEGEYSFIGTVENYDTKVTLILQVIAEEIATYTVEVIANPPAGGTVTGGGEYPAGTSVTVSATTNKGYTFINWTEKEAPISTEAVYAFSMRAEAVCLTANFRETLNLVTNITVTGAEGATTVEKDKTLQMSAIVEPVEATDKTVAWSVENGTGEASIDESGLLTGVTEGTVTVKATANDASGVVGTLVVTVVEPAPVTYTVTFQDHDGEVLKTETVTHGSAATAPANPTRDGHTFTDWDKAFTNVTSDLIVVAQYPINTYTVTFNSNGGETEANPQTKTATHGGNVDALPTAPTKIGHAFTGWNTQADGSGTAFTETTPVKADLTVYAQWVIPVTSITVTGAEGVTTVEKDKTLQMSVAIEPAEATDKSVTWSVENGTGSATIDTTGLLTGQQRTVP